MIASAQMLRTAERLARVADADPGPPGQCDLRRSISTAYYALFHQLTRHGVHATVAAAGEDDVALVARWFSHQGLRSAAQAVVEAVHGRRPGEPRPAVALLLGAAGPPIPAQLVVVASSFEKLQDARHVADYGNADEPDQGVAFGRVELADGALRASSSLWRARDAAEPERRAAHDAYRCFLLLALLSSGGPKSRR